MAFKVIYKGLEVICDTLEDLDVIATAMQKKQASAVTHTNHRAVLSHPTLFSNGGNSAITENSDKHSLFLNGMSDNARTLFKTLMTGDTFTDSDLRKVFEVDDNQVLAGYVSGMSKAAKRAGFEAETVFTKDMKWSDEGKRVYTYTLVPTFKEQMRGYVKD